MDLQSNMTSSSEPPKTSCLKRRRVLRGEITYSKAEQDEKNVLHTLGYWKQREEFFGYLVEHRAAIETTVAHHLGLKTPKACHVAASNEWLCGGFNVCVPVDIDGRLHTTRVLMRFPLPYQVGEHYFPGNSDEKIQCEAGAYVWLQDHCPAIPIPRLCGIGLSTGIRVW